METGFLKNTLMKRAFEGTDFAQLDNLLDGPSAIAISKEDATAPIRVLNNVAKEAEALEFKGAVVEGTLYDIDGIKSLASIPSREELISKLGGSLTTASQAPISWAFIIPSDTLMGAQLPFYTERESARAYLSLRRKICVLSATR